MTIRPIDFSGMIQRTDDVGVLKHQEDAKPQVDQQNIQSQMVKKEDEVRHQVIESNRNEELENHADAKEEGKNAYFGQKKKKKTTKKQNDGKVIVKKQSGSFDIKV